VEAQASELSERAPAIPHGKKMFRIWTEVENFASIGDELCVYTADRVTGKISFPPAQRVWQNGVLSALERPVAAVPALGREIRAWYRCGGGPLGNVNPGTISVLKDPLPGKLEITNPEAVTGGRAVESLDHALVRGPRELHALERAVTARDFELLALRSGGVARAKALTKAERWKYAHAGTVEIVIVPSLAQPDLPSQVTLDSLTQQQTEATRRGVLDLLNERRPLGTACNVCWSKYKTVRVEAKIEARAEEDISQLKARLMADPLDFVVQRKFCYFNPSSHKWQIKLEFLNQRMRELDEADPAWASPDRPTARRSESRRPRARNRSTRTSTS
jgi:predicted phage baseplate assembly protein